MILYVDLSKTNSSPKLEVSDPLTLAGMETVDSVPISSLNASTSRPTDDEINRLFEEALNAMDLQPAKVRELRNCDMEKKLKIAMDMRKTSDFKPPGKYLEELKAAIDNKKSSKKKKKLDRESTSTTILKHIEICLRTNPIQWVESFLTPPNNGLEFLLDYLTVLQEIHFRSFDASEIDHNSPHALLERKNSSDGSGNMKPSKSQNKFCIDGSGIDDIQIIFLCFRAMMNTRVGIGLMFSNENVIYALTKCILHPSMRTKASVFELLSAVCLVANGHDKIIDAFDRFRVDFRESHRFKTLMWMLKDSNNLNNLELLPPLMQLINLIVHSVEDVNYRVYLQQDFNNLGLEEILKDLEYEESEQIQTQVRAYQKNFINLNEITAKSEKCEQVEDKLNLAIQELSRQREKYQRDLGGMNEKNIELAKRLDALISERQELIRTTEEKDKSLRTLERQQFETEKKLRSVEGQLTAEVQKTKKAIEKELSIPTTPTKTTKQSAPETPKANENHVDSAAKTIPAPPPPPPSIPTNLLNTESKPIGSIPIAPPPPPNFKMGNIPPPPPFLNPMAKQPEVPSKKVIKTNFKLPAFNWTAMPSRNVKETVFHNLDDEKLVGVLHLDLIESMFGEDPNLEKNSGPPSPSSLSTAASSNHSANTILDPKKLQNIAIMRRRLGKSTVEVMSAIHALNLNQLSPDEVDILTRMISQSQDEAQAFQHYTQENNGIEGLSLDEQFVWKLQNIERVETKLKLMMFMSEFAEIIKKIEPEICKLDLASKSVMESKKFQKVLEVLLAIGNAMNAGKNRPLVYGFKLSTLSRLTMQKSPKDHNITILHGLVDAIEHSNVECIDFTKEMNFVDDASSVVLSDVEVLFNNLSRNFKMAEEELNRDNPPQILVSFVTDSKPHIERNSEKLAAAKAEYAKCAQMFGEDPKLQTPKDFFTLIYDFMQNFDHAREHLQKRQADKEPKSARPIVVKRQAQPSGDAQVLKELQSRFGGNRKPTNKPQSNQIADGDLERMMTGLKETGFVANKNLVRKPRSQIGDLQQLAAGHREVCRERQA